MNAQRMKFRKIKSKIEIYKLKYEENKNQWI